MQRNPHLSKLTAGYLFPEINRRKQAFLQKTPHPKIISLGVGDTTEAIPQPIVKGLREGVENLGNPSTYTGYGPEQGIPLLRQKISEVVYNGLVPPEDIFISDGSKCDIGRLQVLFGSQATIAVQDPSYPVYVDSSVIMGQTGLNEKGQYKGITYLSCNPENQFFPDLERAPRTDIICFCSPNNPTGAVATKDQLEKLVAFAKKNKSIIVFDGAYNFYIQDDLPKSIYEIEGARDVAIELGSFSKMAGFTGVRLGWSVVPSTLKYEDGTPIKQDWNRLHCTIFNGASNIAQAGAIAALSDEGLQSMYEQVKFYLENAHLLRDCFKKLGYTVYGGDNAPYLWVHFKGRPSWDVFEEILEKHHIICTPGVGFGPAGEGFVRFSAFGHRENILEAIKRFEIKEH